MFLSILATTPIEEAIAESTTHTFDPTLLIGIIGIIAVILIVVGLIKKTLWLCIVAVVIAAFLGITSPEAIVEFKDNVVSYFSDMVGEDVFENIGQEFENIDKDIDNFEEDNAGK